MTWGDVLQAAIGACCAVGTDEPVDRRQLAKLIDDINAAVPPVKR